MSKYGDRLFDSLADQLGALGVTSCDRRQLYGYVEFYRLYPQIVGTLSPEFRRMLPSLPSTRKVGTSSPQSGDLALPAETLVEASSYSHFELLAVIDDPLMPPLALKPSPLAVWPTIRQLFVDGKLVGGCDVVSEMNATGALKELLPVDPTVQIVAQEVSLAKVCRCSEKKGQSVGARRQGEPLAWSGHSA